MTYLPNQSSGVEYEGSMNRIISLPLPTLLYGNYTPRSLVSMRHSGISWIPLILLSARTRAAVPINSPSSLRAASSGRCDYEIINRI